MFLDFLFPPFCVQCGRIGTFLCPACKKNLQPILISETICPICEKPSIDGRTHVRCQNSFTLDGLTSLFHYTDPIRPLVKQIKYQYVTQLLHTVDQLYAASSWLSFLQTYAENCTIIPVPLHKSRQRERGFNQAELLGKSMSSILHISMNVNILCRPMKTVPQAQTIHREQRLQNMKGVFSLNPKVSTMPANVFLIDDVFTTGATMRESASILKKRGVKWVWGITLAR